MAFEVTITDPAHPLFGRTFPLIHNHSPRGKSELIIQLPNGLLRSVPRLATDLSLASSQPASEVELPFISVWTILPLARFVQTLPQASEEVPLVNSISPPHSEHLPAEPGARLSAYSVESIESRTTETGSPKAGRIGSADTVVPSANGEGKS